MAESSLPRDVGYGPVKSKQRSWSEGKGDKGGPVKEGSDSSPVGTFEKDLGSGVRIEISYPGPRTGETVRRKK